MNGKWIDLDCVGLGMIITINIINEKVKSRSQCAGEFSQRNARSNKTKVYVD